MGLPLPSSAIVPIDNTDQITIMMANTALPWRRSLTMYPNVNARAKGMITMLNISMKLLNGVEFSNGWAELTLKNPPPLVPSCLMAIWLAAGPPAITWVVPSTVVTSVCPWKFWMTP